ncbi:MAG: hypothetical protein AB7J32_20845 [Pseudonocardia sp.]
MSRRSRSASTPPATIVELVGSIADDLPGYARPKIAHVLARTRRPVPYSRLRVVHHGDPGRERPVTAQLDVDLDGQPLCVHVDARTPREAVDRVVDRLAVRLARMAPGWEARRGRTFTGAPGEWRHGYPPEARTRRHAPPEPGREP